LDAALANQIIDATGPVGIMLHHATLDDDDRATLGDVLGLLNAHETVRLHAMRQWIGDKP
jgi:hypothetical protein